ncbi:ferritin family protein [Methylovirgula sp. HY1]|uniref:ferritin family protein n=1 Tax=Methylovirgula sp. HY1 TaxID=2822761 RepID=UPI001C5A72F8|nr:ferritin family protein [Methylovirgula sp. HY1]QXX76584.1 Nigerythrin [Methylovirgula sp. HY1]
MRRISLKVTTVAALIALMPVAAMAGELNPRTSQNLETAMHGEAYANLKYKAYAQKARASGKMELAGLFETAANVEANEHFAREADALHLAKADDLNLVNAMAGEHYENTTMYKRFTQQACEDGDIAVAKLFDQIAQDEGDHYEAYKRMLMQMKTHSR